MSEICAQTRPLCSAYLDNELGATESLTVEAHLRECRDCAAELAALSALSQQIKQQALYHTADAALSQRVQKTIQSSDGAAQQPIAKKPPRTGRTWLQLGGAIAAALLLATGLNWYWNLNQSEARARSEIVSSHIRSLLSQRPFDVASSDRHTVKPWFNGKVDFAPPVLDLSPQGFTLQGGRLDYIDQRTVAVIVYGRRKHVINLYARPDPKTVHQAPRATQTTGYSLVEWQAGGIRLVAVSDLAVAEVLEFARLFADH